MGSEATISWLKLSIIGMPGTECGRVLHNGGLTTESDSFKAEFGPCAEPARWCVGSGLLVCQRHAEIVAAEFGDSIEDIERAWKDRF